jgi:hypothetical protein
MCARPSPPPAVPELIGTLRRYGTGGSFLNFLADPTRTATAYTEASHRPASHDPVSRWLQWQPQTYRIMWKSSSAEAVSTLKPARPVAWTTARAAEPSKTTVSCLASVSGSLAPPSAACSAK